MPSTLWKQSLVAGTPPFSGAPRSHPEGLLDQIGNTPLIRLNRVARGVPGIEIWYKLEFLNPGGSVKDRPGRNIILEAERDGRLNPQKTILDATSEGASGASGASGTESHGTKWEISHCGGGA